MKDPHILVLYEVRADPYHTHRVSSHIFGAAYLKHGYKVRFANMAEAGFSGLFSDLVSSGNLAAIHCEQGHGLHLRTQVGTESRGIFEHLGIPAIAHIRDHPFTPHVAHFLSQPGAHRRVFHIDRESVAMASELAAHPEIQAFAPHVYLDYRLDREAMAVPPSRREIPLLFVGTYRDPEDRARGRKGCRPPTLRSLRGHRRDFGR